MELQSRSGQMVHRGCAEHIAAAEDFIRGMIVENVMKTPAAPDRDIAKIDAGILAMVPDRTQ